MNEKLKLEIGACCLMCAFILTLIFASPKIIAVLLAGVGITGGLILILLKYVIIVIKEYDK